ncbi:Polyamine transporter 4 [Candida viswanathii]|uniref:Polyamine transporter 4 n=1 Tax=Candida viswanathii TaxID=5486 RepID=A0A367Y9M1_9ASCO|nr:Polyamine transporter 4 [Candida viswanathii]
MGLFGTSKEEEDQLRQAAAAASNTSDNAQDSRRSFSSNTDASAYDTAEEYDNEDDTHGVTHNNHEVFQKPASINDTPAPNLSQSDDDHSTVRAHDLHHTPEAKGKDDEQDHDDNDEEVDDSDISHPKVIHGDHYDIDEENRLNRQFTIERMRSHRSIEEMAEEEIEQEKESLHPKKTGSASPTGQPDEKVYTPQELQFDSPEDMANPHNWAKWKKWVITYTASFLCLVCSLGSSLYTGGIPEIMVRFGASQELCLSGLTFYLLGLAIGPALAAPLSEVYGRKPVYVYSLPIAMLFTMGVGLSKNIRTLLVLRFFCGFFSSPAMSVASGTISDLWANDPAEQSFAVAIFCLSPFLGPVIGPIIGGFASEHKNWQWSSAWILLMFFGAVWPFTVLSPETYKPVILTRTARKRGLKVDAPTVDIAFLKKVVKYNLLLPIKLIYSEPIVLILSLYISFIFAVLFGFFEAFPVIFRGVYHMDLGVSGLPFIAVGLGLIFGIVVYVILDKIMFFPKNPDGTRGKRDENGNFIWDPPERKLLIGKIGAPCLPIALFWLGWTGRTASVHWMAPTASGFPFGFGLILIFLSVVLYFAMSFPPMYVASAIAANNLMRYILASVFPLFTVQCFENLGIGWAGSLFAFISLAMVPVPFIFSRYGAKFRERSPYGYVAFFKKMAQEKAMKEAAAAKAKEAQGSEGSSDSDQQPNAPEEVVAQKV